ncbi:MAG: NUDIX hydrolase, partial [Bacillota bacterium]
KKEDPEGCAYRELEEETGYKAKKMRKLTAFFTTPGFTNEVIHLYAAQDLAETSQKTDDDEFIDVLEVSRADAMWMIRSGEIKDAKSIIGILMAEELI